MLGPMVYGPALATDACMHVLGTSMQYIFTVVWPTSWAPKGYTTFAVGSTSLEQAREWHSLMATSIDQLKLRASRRTLQQQQQLPPRLSPSVSEPGSQPGDAANQKDLAGVRVGCVRGLWKEDI